MTEYTKITGRATAKKKIQLVAIERKTIQLLSKIKNFYPYYKKKLWYNLSNYNFFGGKDEKIIHNSRSYHHGL
jgi:hypothetical protein